MAFEIVWRVSKLRAVVTTNLVGKSIALELRQDARIDLDAVAGSLGKKAGVAKIDRVGVENIGGEDDRLGFLDDRGAALAGEAELNRTDVFVGQ